MIGKKIETIAKKATQKMQNKNSCKIGYLNNEAVLFTNNAMLIANKYDNPEEIKLYKYGDEAEPIESHSIKYWKQTLSKQINAPYYATIKIPKLFYKVAKAFKNPSLTNQFYNKQYNHYTIIFMPKEILITLEDEIQLRFAEDYYMDCQELSEFNPVYDLAYFMILKPKELEINRYYGTYFPALIHSSHDFAIIDYDTCILMNINREDISNREYMENKLSQYKPL